MSRMPVRAGERLFAPYYTTTRNGEPPRLIHIESLYDYTKFENRWYSDPMLDGAMWSPPHSVEPKGPMVVGYCAPFAGTTPAEPGEEPAPGGLAIGGYFFEPDQCPGGFDEPGALRLRNDFYPRWPLREPSAQ